MCIQQVLRKSLALDFFGVICVPFQHLQNPPFGGIMLFVMASKSAEYVNI